VLTVDWTVVGLASFGDNLAILTEGSPYIAQGLTPDTMAMAKMETGVPCMSRRGIVDLGYAAVYPSPEGLAMISPTETRLVTAGIYTANQWRNLKPETFIAGRDKGRYLFSYTAGDADEILGGDAAGWDTPPAVDTIIGGTASGWTGPRSVLSGGDAFSTFGSRQFASIDVTVEPADVTMMTVATPQSLWRDETDNVIYFLAEDLRSVYRWDDPDQENARLRWRSKLFSGVSPLSFGAIFIRTLTPNLTEAFFEVRVFANGDEVATVTKANQIARLPAKFMAEEWQVELATDVAVVSVQMAGTVDELMMGAA
jgi:hypothetical protein